MNDPEIAHFLYIIDFYVKIGIERVSLNAQEGFYSK